MNKEFVPYQQSLELKQLGFNEECFGLFVRDKSLLIKEMPNQQECEYFGGILAPTFSQAFRFFREKYELYPYIETAIFVDDNSIVKYDYVILVDDNSPTEVYNNLPCDKFEEAELECLKKLIEIVKEKQ